MELKVYKLHFTTPLHIGYMRDDYSISMKTISSDTMTAALTSCLAKMGETVPDDGDLGFVISDLFPFYQGNESTAPLFFFPRPFKIKLSDDLSEENAKRVKKVKWLEKSFFEQALSGCALFSNSDIRKIQDGNEEYLCKERITEKFVDTAGSQPTPRVVVPRNGVDDAVPFYMEKIIFKDYSGLYFIAEGNTTLLDKAMELLKAEGIGTDRNVGNGFFEFEKPTTIDLNITETGNSIVSLSNYIPSDYEELSSMMQGENLAYEFHRRGGWITTHPYNSLRKKYVYAFVPGSVFNAANASELVIKGKIVNLKPDNLNIDHEIWRSGKSIFLPIKL